MLIVIGLALYIPVSIIIKCIEAKNWSDHTSPGQPLVYQSTDLAVLVVAREFFLYYNWDVICI